MRIFDNKFFQLTIYFNINSDEKMFKGFFFQIYIIRSSSKNRRITFRKSISEKRYRWYF